MLSNLVVACIRFRFVVVGLLVVVLGVGAWALKTLPIDALPDVSNVQVDIITEAAGLSPVEVERTVTFPIENALNGVPGNVELRSVSRFGLSAVTVVFRDGTDIWFARQLILERIRSVQGSLPPQAGLPELGPVSSGLGTIYRFVVSSKQHSAMQLRTLLDWEIVPKLRSVRGVIEVNTMGGELKQFQVVVDHSKLRAVGLSIQNVVESLRAANMNVGAGYIQRDDEAFAIRGRGMLRDESEIAQVVLRTEPNGTPVLVRQVADVKVAPAPRYGVVTHNGEGEAVTGIVMMLIGSNSRDVIHAVHAQMEAVVKPTLPPGVEIKSVYDRADFVGRTLSTVATNLVEGVVVVTFVLALMLGTLRGALVAALGIPVAMAIALLGMRIFGITGDLMSLGAIDFGFLVDGPIVLLEAVIAAMAGKKITKQARAGEYAEVAKSVASPVAFSVAIIMLVYIPLLTLEGVEGKMFRPMAITMACALFGALVYAVVFFPPLMVLLVPPSDHHKETWIDKVTRRYAPLLERALVWNWPLLGAMVVLLVGSGWWFASTGAEFVPRIFEGDAVVAIRRAPSISLDRARELDLQTEKLLLEFPEIKQVLGQTGRAELALDSVGNDNTDMLIPLKPMKEWTTTDDFDDLSVLLKDKIETHVAGTFVSVSQPIEDLTNQLISGSRADVSIKVFGPDLDELVKLSNLVGGQARKISGTGDLRIERIMGQPMIVATADRARMARYGVRVAHAFDVLAAAREGLAVGQVYEEERRFDLKVFGPPARPTAAALGDLFVATGGAGTGNIPLHEVVKLEESEGPSVVKRQNRERLIRVDVNLRGRDLVSWVAEAREVISKSVPLGTGYRIEWGGQFENFERASKRLAIVVPVVILIIVGMLFWMFSNARFALAVFALVPLATIGGMLGLIARGMPFSLPAAVGFIALGGISVLNGVVIATEVRRELLAGIVLHEALMVGSVRSVRAVLTTAAVAAFGFLPMAMSNSAGSEVQRPLATVVIAGILLSAVLTLLVFPGILKIALRGWVAPRQSEPLPPSA
ncbi:MAG TPA: CusA/CzcA family heavy metal efflux RND transporter [Polyangiaceae bacterium]|nr:CusA/CzcA family heavy metal efflux RND transporter [Polyangiaceae bacterium]